MSFKSFNPFRYLLNALWISWHLLAVHPLSADSYFILRTFVATLFQVMYSKFPPVTTSIPFSISLSITIAIILIMPPKLIPIILKCFNPLSFNTLIRAPTSVAPCMNLDLNAALSVSIIMSPLLWPFGVLS